MHNLSQQKFCHTCKGKRRVWILEALKRTFEKCPECEGVGFLSFKPIEIKTDEKERHEGQNEGREGKGEMLDQVADSFCRAIGSEIEAGIAEFSESIKDEIKPKKRGRPAKRQ